MAAQTAPSSTEESPGKSAASTPAIPVIPVGPHEPFVALEHVNINAGPEWNENLEAFWVGALGGASDPRAAGVRVRNLCSATDLRWINVGLQQFHMPLGEPEDTTQVLRGEIVLEYADEEALRVVEARLTELGVDVETSTALRMGPEAAAAGGGGSGGGGSDESDGAPTGCCLRFRDHAGNHFVAVAQSARASSTSATKNDGCHYLGPLWHMPVRRPDADAPLPGAHSKCLGLRGITFFVPRGAARSICEFYAAVFKANTNLEDFVGADRPHRTVAKVCIGSGRQYLEFEERPDDEVPAYDGHHIAVYVNDFAALYRRCDALGIVWNNPRFPALTYDTEADALRHAEFRILDIVRAGERGEAASKPEPIYRLEHEVRSLNHPGFAYTLRAVREVEKARTLESGSGSGEV